MKRNSIIGLWLVVLTALLNHKPVLAASCERNALQPKPVTVAYDSQASRPGKVTFTPAADGTLRALDGDSGNALWTFTPTGLDITHQAEGLMSDVRVLRFDSDLDGSIDPARGDKVWLYFGLRRGGRSYYALDVTNRVAPQLLWQIGPTELPGLGETWSTPTLARVRVAGAAQNGEHFVLILGGGYDEVPGAAHRIFMVDAANGQLLWYAGGSGPGAPDLVLPQMTDSVAARVAVLDTDGDGFADRLYASDTGGRLWRFDIWNGRDRSQLVTGGILAALSGVSSQDVRRFFSAPDVALIQRRGAAAYFNLAIGSGNRAAPFDLQVHDRFYAIRDRNAFVKLPQPAYDASTPINDSELFDISDSLGAAVVPPAASGWKLELRLNGGWSGEKVLAEALTLDGVILFATYQPTSEAECAGENRVYALNVDHGNPAKDLNDDKQIDGNDASAELSQSGIAGEVELSLPAQRETGNVGNGPPPEAGAPATCKVGDETLRLCVDVETSVRTFWQRKSDD